MDSAIEIMIWLFIGVVLIGLITAVAYNWNLKKTAEDLQDMYSNDGSNQAFKTDEAGFARAAMEFNGNCTDADSAASIYVKSTGLYADDILTKERLFSIYKELGWCKSIQSRDYSCGTREDVVMADIELPAVVNLKCSGKTLFIS
jgi:hypothetical protein